MSFPSKTKMPIAVDKFTPMDFNPTHVTTSNFMNFDVCYSLELAPDTKINNFNVKTFARLEPLAVPTFGLASIHKKAFFVPYRTIFPAWDDFINDDPHTYSDGVTSNVPIVPSVKNSVIVSTFITLDFALPAVRPEQADITVRLSQAGAVNTASYKFTSLGRRLFKILNSLGYRIHWSLADADFNHSLLPLFALSKVYADWYYPNQYSQDNVMSNIIKWFNYDLSNIDISYTFSPDDLAHFARFLSKVCYDNDYFTSAWDKPGMPNNSFSDIRITDITSVGQYGSQINASPGSSVGADLSPKLLGRTETGNVTTIKAISQYALTALKSLTDYLKRHQIAGARVLDRYLSRWGVTLSAEKLKRSLYIGGANQDIQFGDVTATADTDGAALGDYAGKGVSYGEGNWNFTTDEFGLFIVVCSIVPKTSYYQGAHHQTMNLTKFDFYTPEFDNLGVEPLLTRSVYLPINSETSIIPSDDGQFNVNEQIFGYVPRYSQYKIAKDILGGDYVLNSRNSGKDAWTLFRDLTPQFAGLTYDQIKHGVNFVNGSDSNQYNRIFNVTDDGYDKFNIIHQMNIDITFPGHSLYDDYEFDTDGKAKEVTLETGSVKAN